MYSARTELLRRPPMCGFIERQLHVFDSGSRTPSNSSRYAPRASTPLPALTSPAARSTMR